VWRPSELVARLRRLSWRGRVAVAVAGAALVLLALRPSRPDPGAPVPVTRGDLVLTVEVEGELAAVRSVEIGVPPVTEVEFKIAFLAPEGGTVTKGDPVLRFDTEALELQLAEKKAEYAEAAKKVEQKEIDLRMKLLDIDQRMAQATSDLGRARLKVDVPAEVQQRNELEKAKLDQKGLERDLENMRAERRSTETLNGAELASLRSQRDRALGRVRASRTGSRR
jgi:HlyD family secretion protein